eukprot:12883374-Prorocentrum_lima.AAC.1
MAFIALSFKAGKISSLPSSAFLMQLWQPLRLLTLSGGLNVSQYNGAPATMVPLSLCSTVSDITMGLLSLTSMLKKQAISLHSLTAFLVFCQR